MKGLMRRETRGQEADGKTGEGGKLSVRNCMRYKKEKGRRPFLFFLKIMELIALRPG